MSRPGERRRLGQLTPEQERAVESLLMSMVDKISQPLIQQMRRSDEAAATEFVNVRRRDSAALKEEQSDYRQITNPVTNEG